MEWFQLLADVKYLITGKRNSPSASSQHSGKPNAPGNLVRHPNAVILFLDFDGVLHRGQSGTFAQKASLEAFLRLHPYLDVVISSSWRISHSFEYLRSIFSNDLQTRVIGTTPNLSAKRELEILTIVRQYNVKHWFVLDDDHEQFTSVQSHLIKTDYYTGLQDSDISILHQKINQLGYSNVRPL